MGNKTGPAAKGNTDTDQQEEEKKKYEPCIVTFRPCKDWRGEYGFDWVREGKEDYEERYSCGYEYVKTHTDPLQKKMGSHRYKKWRKSVEEDLNKKLAADPNFDYEWHLNFAIKNKCEELNVEPPLDTHAWQERIKDPNYKNPVQEKFTEPDNPFEYLYHPKHIVKVVYRVNRAQFGDVWSTEEFCYHDMANGDVAAQNSIGIMESHVNIGHRSSLIGGKDAKKYYYPIYSDKEDPEFPEMIMPANFKCRSDDPVYECYENEKCPFCRGYDDCFLNNCGPIKNISFQRKDAEGWTIEVGYYYLTNKSRVFVKLQYSKDGDKTVIYEFLYYNEQLKIKIDGQYKLLKDVVDDNGLYRDLKQQFLTSRILQNERMDIANLCADKNLDNITVTVYYPRSLEKVELTPEMGFKRDELGNPAWGGFKIYSWKESYENSFTPLYFQLKGDEKPRKYCVPVLRMTTFPRKCTKFLTHNFQDAPIKSDLPWNEVKIRVKKIAGECQRLILKPDIEGIVEISPNKISNFEEEEITIKYIGRERGNNTVFINAYSDQDWYRKRVGQLKVLTSCKGELPISFITVETKGVILDKEAKETLQDQLDWTVNMLSQVGFDVKVTNYSLKVNSKFYKQYFHGEKYNEDGSRALWKTFYERLPEDKKDRFFDFKVMFVPIRVNVEGGAAKGWTDYLTIKPTTESESEYIKRKLGKKDKEEQNQFTCESETIIELSKTMLANRAYLQVVGHEMGHALGLSHHFQRIADPNEPYGFLMSASTNLMDYYTLSYSTHQYQWRQMEARYFKNLRERKQKVNSLPPRSNK